MARDRPWLTVEFHTNASLKGFVEREYILANRIGKMLSNAQYATYVVNEVCGHKGCRNVLCEQCRNEASQRCAKEAELGVACEAF